MLNLTQKQKALLTWMREEKTVEVCSDYCTKNGEVAGKSRLPIRVHRATINKRLWRQELIFGAVCIPHAAISEHRI